MPRYVVAKANLTALPFVVRLDRLQPKWIVVKMTESYQEARVFCDKLRGEQ